VSKMKQGNGIDSLLL